jgi:hypothetical protein
MVALGCAGHLELSVDLDESAAPGDVLPALARFLINLVRRGENSVAGVELQPYNRTSREGAGNTHAALTTTSL